MRLLREAALDVPVKALFPSTKISRGKREDALAPRRVKNGGR